ncbi:MAG: GDSL-type esterase/lipase family protein [Blastocatellia bacterium]|nr:GDSL-type esterase/lipase family protein [Blastocatellia bacterium]
MFRRKDTPHSNTRHPLTRLRVFAASDGQGHALSGKTARTIISFVALALLPYMVPAMKSYRIPVPQGLAAMFGLQPGEEIISARNLPGAEQFSSPSVSAGFDQTISTTPGKIEDPSGRALDHFFESLLVTEIFSSPSVSAGFSSRGGQTRISHYGDSPITNDGITSTVRRRLQLKFGDAGHGFILIAKPWGWYGHVGVAHDASRGWQSDPMFIARADLYGLGGVSFTSQSASASFGTVEEGEVGRSVSSFDIYYLARPGGGDFEVEVDGAPRARVSTANDEVKSGFYRVEVKEGAHRLTIRAAGDVRMFGVALESGRPGVQYDSLGVNGAFIALLANHIDADHWAEQLRHRQPDLVIIGYGANESQFERLPMDRYEQDTKETIRRIRAALPEVSIMFVGPMDRGMRGAGGAVVTRPMIPKLIAYQRRIAAETGCAFFDTFTAMGGAGTVARWREARPRLMGGDLTHPTAQGAEIVGTLIYDAIMEAYEDYKNQLSAISRQPSGPVFNHR